MRYEELLEVVGDRVVFDSSLLRAGDVSARDVASQLSRWAASGRLIQLRRGLYAVPPPYARRRVHPFVVANALVTPSYVSLHSALSYHGLIPDVVAAVTSVTTARPQERETAVGVFAYRHVKPALLWGSTEVSVGEDAALVASPEKALFDLAYLEPAAADAGWVAELRLQRLDAVDLDRLAAWAEERGPSRLTAFVGHVRRQAEYDDGWGEWRS